MRERFLSHGRGLLLVLVGVAAILWLAVAGKLALYIHPRYIEFTVVMAVIAGVVAIVAAALLPRADEHEGDHEHAPRSRRRATLLTAASVALIVATTAVLLVVPPSTLTSGTAAQRDINASAGGGAGDAPVLVAGDGSGFTVKDWAGLLRQGADEQYLADARPDITGFVMADPDDPDNVFYVARFVITCCAVDAQPVGVPVYSPGWRDAHPVDSWVQVTGRFVANPSTSSMQAVALEPADVTSIDEPADPYVY